MLSGLSVTETAMRMGFDTSSYFANVFRRYMALSPTEYVISCKNGARHTFCRGETPFADNIKTNELTIWPSGQKEEIPQGDTSMAIRPKRRKYGSK